MKVAQVLWHMHSQHTFIAHTPNQVLWLYSIDQVLGVAQPPVPPSTNGVQEVWSLINVYQSIRDPEARCLRTMLLLQAITIQGYNYILHISTRLMSEGGLRCSGVL